jgi:Cobalamin-independent synthase, Catalytic domain
MTGTRPWPPGAATGMGSLPGTDAIEAVRIVLDELPDLPHLPELPGRGPGADLIGRSAALLTDLPVEIQPSGWRLTARPGRDVRRARELLARDLDALHQEADGYQGALKLQLAGPWTLAAGVELPSGHRIVTDPGASRDLTQSLADGLAQHLAEIRQRIPGGELVVQLDEPSVPAVLAGEVPTPSGYGTVRAVDPLIVEQAVASVLAVAPSGGRAVHCCARGAPVTLFRSAGADAISLDVTHLETADNDALGEAVEAGVALWLGVVPGTDATISVEDARKAIESIWRTLGFSDDVLAASVVPTPACGLAGATLGYARRALHLVAEVGRGLAGG